MVTDAFRSVVIGWTVVMVMMTQRVTPYSVVVNTDKGKVEGKTHHVHGKKIDVFYGIPYARPPLGALRFLHPEQIDPWSDTRDATTPPNACMQARDETFGNFSGANQWNPNTNISEDCLYLNIWTPHQHRRHHKPHRSNKTVFVWVYGGGFSTGSASLDMYDGRFLAAEHDVVVVSMQFRVGSLGYFALGTPHSPGNAGIMDLRMSLEWIQRNIHRFGGSAHNVTLVGESSGAASIGLLMLSPIGRGLFHRAILQSAAPQLHWVTASFEEGRRRSMMLAKRLGCYGAGGRSDVAILSCLRQVPASRFTVEEGYVSEGTAQFSFHPVVDGTFLSKPPMEYLRNGEFKKIPLLLGANAHEGSWLLVYANKHHFNLETDSKISPESYDTLVEDIFRYYPRYPRELNHFGLDAIKFQYTDWSDPEGHGKRRDSIVNAIGDVAFSCGVVELGQVASRHSQDVFMYKFSHRMSNQPWPSWMGVMHGDEIFLMFGRPLVKSLGYSNLERKLSKRMMKMWTNFAKTGNPNNSPGETNDDHWPKYLPNDQSYLEIDLDLVQYATNDVIPATSVRHGFLTQRCAFWEHYLPKVAKVGASRMYTNCSRISASTSAQGALHGTTSGLTLLLFAMGSLFLLAI